MNYALLNLASPSQSGCESAYQFACALVAAGHRVSRIFFYGDGVYQASLLQQPPQGSNPIHQRWAKFSKEHNTDLVVCIAAALKRGVCDHQEAQRYNLPASNLAPGFCLSGLGQLVDASVNTDRVITFG
ncbi:sulfurtransferase complex subunit TusD [Simiduia litorea]|uniref:sulfurtransferase complex subunit TusD n=1 Tax=Simiduia litorea TaxID=1435348 RepID=UPI0036F27272